MVTEPLLPAAVAAMGLSFWILAGLALLGRRERAQVVRSLSAVTGVPVTAAAAAPTESLATRVVLPLLRRLSRVAQRVTPAGASTKLRHRLDLAGSPGGLDVEQVVGAKVLAAGLGFLVGLLLWPGGAAPLVAMAAAGAGFCLPDLLLTNTGVKRQLVLQRSLPDALDLLTISVEAGLGFDAAMSQVARADFGPLATEFFRVLQEMQIGKSRSEAFRALSDRTDVPELDRFVNAMVQADRLGIPIAAVLKEQAQEMRLRRSQRAEEQAHKVPVKILFPMIVFLLPTIFIIILGPGIITLTKTL